MSKLKSTWWRTACAVVVVCAATAIASPAQTLTTLVTFDGTNGAGPYGALLQATDGNLYGTTAGGGANGAGTVFKITPSGTLKMLYSFCAQGGCTDGEGPEGLLVQATDGNFYGTTLHGGANGYGTVFKITHGGTLTTLYSFCSQSGCADGASPYAGLVQASDGNFYGTTENGTPNSVCLSGCGTVFKVTSGGTLTTLHAFGYTEGAYPASALVQGTDGSLYGTTTGGGINGSGVVFKITLSGTLTALHNFDGTDGWFPDAALVQGADGNFYGTTYEGGAPGPGTVFKITPNGTLTTLHSFDSGDGEYPRAALIQATDGDFYGTTSSGGANGSGTVFKISSTGTLTTSHTFCSLTSCTDGAYPYAGLTQDTNGKLYGTTCESYCNTGYGSGSVFGLYVGLGAFVQIVPAGGKVGAGVRILGNNLTGTTGVTFNGTPATFTVVSSTLITTTVPAGATTGKVQVTTPSGTLTSNVNFRVR
jgi:uncharacterized repeat protein (TIGR03803 family)